jgi:hypothetical protein
MSLRTTAAARQKEINVSITDDATIKRTRFGGGAAVVLEDAMGWKSGCGYRYLGFRESETTAALR